MVKIAKAVMLAVTKKTGSDSAPEKQFIVLVLEMRNFMFV